MDVGSVKFLFPVMVFWCSLRCVVVETQWMAVGSSILLFVIPGVLFIVLLWLCGCEVVRSQLAFTVIGRWRDGWRWVVVFYCS